MRKRSLSIRQKLYVLGFVCLIGASSLAGMAIQFSARVAHTASVIHSERFAPVSKLQELATHLKEVRFRLAGVLLDQMPIPGSRIHLRETVQAAPALWRDFRQAVGEVQGDGGKLVAALDASMPEFYRFAEALDKAYAADDKVALTAMLEDQWPVVQQKVVKPLDAMLPSFSAAVGAETAALETSARHFRDATAAAVFVVLALTLGIAVLVARSLMAGVAEAQAVAQALARGDLTHQGRQRRPDELGQLLAALDVTVARLRSTIGDVRAATGTIATASDEIAMANADLSQRTEEQASSLEETTSSMEELTVTVQQNADSARQANELAATATEVATQGGQVIGRVVQTMNAIDTSSRKIVDITGVIDAIAFQTNILALNAAVEAARAGDQGRGFAVVASEVRTLAQRSAASAKEIKQLIDHSVHDVQDGTRLVDLAGKTMEQIVGSVQRVSGIISEMAAASREQANGIQEVSQSVAQMDRVTQQNAAMVEQASVSADSLKEQAQNLVHAVGVFRLDAAAPPAVPAAPPVVPAAVLTRSGKPSAGIGYEVPSLA
ncbi:methyl-accepting chemotaxis protein [Ramlibacter sp. AN1133]|uniref:methyl-accepting chemotaxis protein n=1 Tax=Ramlibacter sp. AN1133 TaxID=3133429 RepID=UPI0030C50F51